MGSRWPDVPTTGDRIFVNAESKRTMYIHSGNTIDCSSIRVLAVKPLADLIRDTDDASNGKGHLYVRGELNVRGGTVEEGGLQSIWAAGILEIDSSNALMPGKVNLIGGTLNYSGGEIDTVENNTGFFYAFDSGTLTLSADPGKVGAKLFFGRDWAGNGSPGTLKLDTFGNITFYRNATIGIAGPGTGNLIRGGLKLWNMGGEGGATGWFENYGTVSVTGDIPSDMYFNNSGGTLEIAANKKLDIAGWKTLDDESKASYVEGGTTRLKPGATLRLVERYFLSLGQLICDDSGAANSVFNVNGNVDIQGGTLQMGIDENKFGTLAITGSLRFGPQGLLNIHVSGTENKIDKVTAASVTLVESCRLGARTTGVPGAGATEREFLVGSVTGTWGGADFTGDFTWTLDANQKKLTKQ